MNRRNFIRNSAVIAGQAATAATVLSQSDNKAAAAPARQPNIILYLSDQFRWDFLGANGLNSSTRTPNLDAMARRGTNFTHAVTNQPVCGPARSVLVASRYATETGVWRNGKGLDPSLPTIASELRKAGYTSNLIGKWHLAPNNAESSQGTGFVPPEQRGGFLDLWEASNLLEFTTHPYEGTLWDGDGKEITWKDRYRVDFLTDRAERFLRQKHDKPFFLFLSQLEPHQQNDMKRMVGPNGSAERFINAHVPPDLRALPGDWHHQLPDYYGACESIDASLGRIRKILEEEHLADNTIVVFFSDHGCHFMTRNEEYKRSTHNSSLRIPLLIEGPGFNGPKQVQEVTGIINIAPTLLEAAGLKPPASFKGRSMVPLVDDPAARTAWRNSELVQISESMTGRSIRTPEWTYCVADPTGKVAAASPTYREYQLYDQRNDPYELVNLAGRKEYRATAAGLKGQLLTLLEAAGEGSPAIEPAPLYP